MAVRWIQYDSLPLVVVFLKRVGEGQAVNAADERAYTVDPACSIACNERALFRIVIPRHKCISTDCEFNGIPLHGKNRDVRAAGRAAAAARE